MFSAFGGTKKREPLFTFKRKPLGCFVNDPLETSFQDYPGTDLLLPTFDDLSSKKDRHSVSNSPIKLTAETQPSTSSSTTSTEFSNTVIDTSSTLNEVSVIPEKTCSLLESKQKHTVIEKTNKLEPAEDVSIFDFPDSTDSFSEIKVMVASTRTIPEAPKLKRKKSKQSKADNKPSLGSKGKSIKDLKNNSKQVEVKSKQSAKPPTKRNGSATISYPSNFVQSQNSFDIFDFDPEPTASCHLSMNTTFGANSSNSYYNHNIYTYSQLTNTAHNIPNSMCHSMPYEMNHLLSVNNPTNTIQSSMSGSLNDNFHLAHVSNLVNFNNNDFSLQNVYSHDISQAIASNDYNQVQTATIPTYSSGSTVPVEKKRKRNLVAHLKTASGESIPKNKGYDYLSDEEELTPEQQPLQQDVLPLKEIIKERSLSPELSYAERMELELEAVMRTEFGNKEEQKVKDNNTTDRRQRYEPLNKVNVRVTFQKQKK